MIEKEDRIYVLTCEKCGGEKEFDSFDDAVEFKKDKSNGWRTTYYQGDRMDFCPICAKQGGLR